MIKTLVVIVVGIGVVGMGFFGFRSWKAGGDGEGNLVDGSLAACGDKPNCVCSTDSRDEFKAESWWMTPDFAESPGAAISKMSELILEHPRTRIVKTEGNYLHAIFTSALFRYPDDVEILITGDRVEFRSASRVGYSDMGVNRKRMIALKEQFAAAGIVKPTM